MISLSFLNLLGVDIIQLFWVCFQWASSVRWSTDQFPWRGRELYSHTTGTQRQHRQERKEEVEEAEEEGKKELAED